MAENPKLSTPTMHSSIHRARRPARSVTTSIPCVPRGSRMARTEKPMAVRVRFPAARADPDGQSGRLFMNGQPASDRSACESS